MESRTSGIHGTGSFATRDLTPGTLIIEYVGERITREESLRRCELNNPFIFRLDEQHDLDGDVEWNPARFINHSCDPNCDAELIEGKIWIVARRGIAGGEELTFNYGYDLQDYREYPCACGARQCVGFMVAEEFFEHVRAQLRFGSEAAAAREAP
jgi:SET domain-containing protein